MVESYNYDFDIAALLLLIVEMVYVRIQYAHDKYSNRLFILLLHSSIVITIADIFDSMLLTTLSGRFPSIVLTVTCNLYFLINALVFMAFYRYIVEFLGDKHERTVGYYVRTYFPFVFIVECLIANCFANIFFSSGKYGHFSYGSLIIVIYVYPIYYFVLTIFTLWRNRKNINAKQVISVLSFIVMTILAYAVQLIFPEVMALPFAYSISLLIMIFTLETPDYRKFVKASDTLELVREETERKDIFNRVFIEGFSTEICDSVEKMLAKNEACTYVSDDTANKEIREYVNGYGKQIRSTINNVMDFVYSGKTDYTPKDYSVRNVVEEVRNIMLPLAKDASDSLNVEVGPNIPDTLFGAEPVIKQIMINLIGNAVDKTHDGIVSLTLGCRTTIDGGVNLIISVEDSGAGMKRDEVKRLLHVNTKGNEWKKEINDSTDFRILVTKKLVEYMNGKMNIDSATGKGALFTAIIPQTRSSKYN